MSKSPHVITLGMILLTAIGCDTDQKIGRLEKQAEELKAEVNKNRAAIDYDLQAKCSRDAKTWFKENYLPDKNTLLLNHTNHYNKSLNKCYVSVENHYLVWGDIVSGAWINDISLWDIYENTEYGNFTVNHMMSKSVSTDKVMTCELFDKKCTTIEQFNALVRPYLTN